VESPFAGFDWSELGGSKPVELAFAGFDCVSLADWHVGQLGDEAWLAVPESWPTPAQPAVWSAPRAQLSQRRAEPGPAPHPRENVRS
jgi:hypothetical protein